jgi:hypothetical protein
VLRVQQDQQVLKELKVIKDKQELMRVKVHKELLVHRVLKVLLVQVLKVPQGLRVQQDQEDLQEELGHRVL